MKRTASGVERRRSLRGRLPRLLKILRVARRFGLEQLLAGGAQAKAWPWPARLWHRMASRRRFTDPRGVRLRQALEALGPIFVKFGQVLSTRRDLLPEDIADELTLLQDRVPPFAGELAIVEIERGLHRRLADVFAEFDPVPVASASIAQVHFARLHDGREVAVKVLRPGISDVIEHDLELLRAAGALAVRLSADARRLRPLEVIDEFDKYLHDELDLVREAANASQLRRDFADSQLLKIPEMHWDYIGTNVLVMERISGIPINRIDRLLEAGIDLKKLSRDGVEIFFTQVFRHGFFHADMHPGNILVGVSGEDFNRYIALDFGIVGTLTDSDKHYLAHNILAFFRRDYKRVAINHIESGWVPPDTRVDELEAAIRACCEPVIDKPLKDIQFGLVLMRLFQASRRFNVEIQPQLVLLQKTLLNIEGLGRQLDPELDLYVVARPILERWINEQVGWRGLLDRLRQEAMQWSEMLPALPRLTHQVLTRLSEVPSDALDPSLLRQLLLTQRRLLQALAVVIALTAALLGTLAWDHLR